MDVEDDHEEGWQGRRLHLGGNVVLQLGAAMPRCAMVDPAQPGPAADGRILKALGRAADLTFGLQAEVLQVGTVRLGDPAVLS